jgi:hypothetical protein
VPPGAWSTTAAATLPGATSVAISARCRFIGSVLQAGRRSAAPCRRRGKSWKRPAQFCGLVALAGADYLKRRPTLGDAYDTGKSPQVLPTELRMAATRTLGAYVQCSLREFEKCL